MNSLMPDPHKFSAKMRLKILATQIILCVIAWLFGAGSALFVGYMMTGGGK